MNHTLMRGALAAALGLSLALAWTLGDSRAQVSVGTAFTYQGRLTNSGAPVNGACDFQFSLWNADTGGAQIGSTQTYTNTGVSAGYFTIADLDFGAGAFNGQARWLEIAVRCPAGSGSYTALSPRQGLTPAPHALALPGLWTRQNATSPNLIGGFHSNSVLTGTVGATIGGGGFGIFPNRVTDDYGTVGGGANNRAGDNAGATDGRRYATVGGGWTNAASGYAATVGGGQTNTASGDFATVGGGFGNTASGFAATIGGGWINDAAGDYSFVAGQRAKNTNAAHDGVFLFADSTDADLTSTAPNQFLVRAAGGITMYTNAGMTVGVRVNPGSGTWSSISDRALKENVAPVNARDMLSRVASLPIQTWNYKTQDAGIRHIGPMAQDFYAAFGVGEDDTHITTVDADGVALAAIQGLYQVTQELRQAAQEKDAQIAALQAQNAALQAQLAALEARLAALERK